jgi:hypothetical protein
MWRLIGLITECREVFGKLLSVDCGSVFDGVRLTLISDTFVVFGRVSDAILEFTVTPNHAARLLCDVDQLTVGVLDLVRLDLGTMLCVNASIAPVLDAKRNTALAPQWFKDFFSRLSGCVRSGYDRSMRGVSIGHAVELRDVERLGPLQSAFGEHLLDQFGAVQAAKRNEDETWEAL